MIIIGIDPGATGGIAWHDGEEMHCAPMPATDAETADFLRRVGCFNQGSARAFLELVHSMPGQGVSSSFKFGCSYGLIRGILSALWIPWVDVAPTVWMRAVGLTRKPKETKSAWKQRLKGKAQQYYPYLTREITLKTADAVLICHYALQLQVAPKKVCPPQSP